MRTINVPELAKEVATALFNLREMQFEMTGRDARRFNGLVRIICRDMAEKVEDDAFRNFLEEEVWFKPTQETVNLRAAKRLYEDPEMQQKIQEVGERLHEGHDHEH